VSNNINKYQLSFDAENDLKEIAHYTLSHWGRETFDEYRNGLKEIFIDIGNNDVISKSFSNKLPGLRVVKFKYHFIFYMVDNVPTPIIIGVIHEKRDLVKQLDLRL
jgi:toxin ParE1/3/4